MVTYFNQPESSLLKHFVLLTSEYSQAQKSAGNLETARKGSAGNNPPSSSFLLLDHFPAPAGVLRASILQVLLFTVDDGDKHVVRRVHPKRTPVAVSGATLSALGVRNHDDPVESTALLSEQEAQNIYTDNINEASLVLCPAQISSIIP